MKSNKKRQMYWQTMERRNFLKYGAVAGAAALAGCTGGNNTESNGGGGGGNGGGSSSGSGSASGEVTLSVAAPTIAFPAEDPIGKSFTEEYDVDMQLKSVPATPAEMIQLFVAGDGQKQFDVIWDNGGGMEDLLGSRGALAEFDPSNIPNWDILNEPFKEGGYLRNTMEHDGKLVGVPSARNADSIAYLEDEIEQPESWGVVFDPAYKGETAIIDDYANVPHWTALYLRENSDSDVHMAGALSDAQWDAINNIEGTEINNLNEAQMKAVVDYLIAHKKNGQFRTIWQSFGNVSNLLQNGEVVASYAYEPSVVALRKQGHNIGYPAMREGNFEWDDHWFMTSGATDRGQQEGFYRLADYTLTPKYGAMMNDTRGFSSGVPKDVCLDYAKENFSEERYQQNKKLFEERQARFEANGEIHAWNNPNPKILDTYLDEWNRFLNA